MPGESTTLLEAVRLYLAGAKPKENQEEVQRELDRFAHWCGLDRTISELRPPEIGDYAEQMSGSGTSPQAAKRLQAIRDFLSYAKKKGLTTSNLASHVRIPKAKVRGGGPGGRSGEASAELTPDGHAQLVAELERLKGERPPLAIQIRKAAADKDVRENVPLEAAREQLGLVESRIFELERILKTAIIIDPSKQRAAPTVGLGRRVVVKDLGSGQKTTYVVVNRTEASPLEGRISDVSPLGKALISRAVGQEIEVQTPRGITRYSIVKVS